MTTRHRLVLLMLLAAAAGPVAADPPQRGPSERRAESGVSVSPDRAAAIARSATGGQVLGVELKANGRPWYRVKVLVDGRRVQSVGVDARTGAVSR